MQRALEIRQLVWKGGEGGHQGQGAREVTKSPDLQVFSTLPCPHPFPRVAPPLPQGPLPSTLQGGQGGREQGGGWRALGNAARLWVPQDGQAGHLGGGLPPPPQGNPDKQAGLPPPLSPAPALGLPQAPGPQRPTSALPKCFLRTYCTPGPQRMRAGTRAAPAFFPTQACVL